MLSRNCTATFSSRANVTHSCCSAKLIHNGIAPLPVPLPALLMQYCYMKRGDRVRVRGHAQFYAKLGLTGGAGMFPRENRGRCGQPFPSQRCSGRTNPVWFRAQIEDRLTSIGSALGRSVSCRRFPRLFPRDPYRRRTAGSERWSSRKTFGVNRETKRAFLHSRECWCETSSRFRAVSVCPPPRRQS